MRKISKLLLVSILLIILSDVLAYFLANIYHIKNKVILSSVLLIFIIGISLIIYEKRKCILNNKMGATIGTLTGIILGYLSFGTSLYIFFFLLPLYVITYSIVGCAGENCWAIIIIIGMILFGIIGIFIGAYISSKRK